MPYSYMWSVTFHLPDLLKCSNWLDVYIKSLLGEAWTTLWTPFKIFNYHYGSLFVVLAFDLEVMDCNFYQIRHEIMILNRNRIRLYKECFSWHLLIRIAFFAVNLRYIMFGQQISKYLIGAEMSDLILVACNWNWFYP